jgi:hypothetical protein
MLIKIHLSPLLAYADLSPLMVLHGRAWMPTTHARVILAASALTGASCPETTVFTPHGSCTASGRPRGRERRFESCREHHKDGTRTCAWCTGARFCRGRIEHKVTRLTARFVCLVVANLQLSASNSSRAGASGKRSRSIRPTGHGVDQGRVERGTHAFFDLSELRFELLAPAVQTGATLVDVGMRSWPGVSVFCE